MKLVLTGSILSVDHESGHYEQEIVHRKGKWEMDLPIHPIEPEMNRITVGKNGAK